MRATFLGVRGSTCAPGRDFVRYGGNTSCIAVTRTGQDRPTVLLDAGTGIRGVTRLLDGAPFRGTILVSHLHWDHVQGLPFFAAGDRPDSAVRVIIPAQGGSSGRDLLAQLMSPPGFPIEPEGLLGDWVFDAVDDGAGRRRGPRRHGRRRRAQGRAHVRLRRAGGRPAAGLPA